MRRTLPLLLAALALAAAGCGSDDSGSNSTSTAAAAPAAGGETQAADASQPVVIEMKNIQFVPKDATVAVGQPVKWENLDTVDHDAVATSGADFKSDQFGKGGTYEYTPTKAGKIDYVCTLHPGMTGTLDVR